MTNEFDIIEHPLVFMWMKEYAKTDPLGFVFLTQGNAEFFEHFWGASSGKTQKYQYWKKDHLGITLYVYSDDNITYYKVQYLGDKETFITDRKMGAYLTGFLSKLVKEIINH